MLVSQATRNNPPEVGKPYILGNEILVCTYVRESELPDSRGGCCTSDQTTDGTLNPAGWYVEFHYPNGTESYRRFIRWEES